MIIQPCDIEVVTFVATDGAYFCILGDSRRADIIKTRNFQPPIADPEDYASYMWIKAYQGHFVLRQQFVENQPTGWRVVQEVEAEESDDNLFESYGDHLAKQLETSDSLPPPAQSD